ncbi:MULTISPECIES: hypothetical protein [unclassified Nostoc]|nr:hypothetical protein [Nostoc sp. DedQUE03]MDZ7976463.1 hypothetical protein [Nostoc sp. DedQUE03]MDZ8042786.1 hypothetical protein [Nostoc sp. DedQUE02]
MSQIRAVIVNPNVPGRLVFGEVDTPIPASNEVPVKVAAISFNRGELRR